MNADQHEHPAGWGVDLAVGIIAGGVIGSLGVDIVANILWPFRAPLEVFGPALGGWDWITLGSSLGAVVGVVLMRARRAALSSARATPHRPTQTHRPAYDPAANGDTPSPPTAPAPPKRRLPRVYALSATAVITSVVAAAAAWSVTSANHRAALAEHQAEMTRLETQSAELERRLEDAEREAAEMDAEATSLARELDRVRGSSPVTRGCFSTLETRDLRLNQVDWYGVLVGLLQETTADRVLALSFDPSNAGWACIYQIEAVSINDTSVP